jgi:hypothetical protein
MRNANTNGPRFGFAPCHCVVVTFGVEWDPVLQPGNTALDVSISDDEQRARHKRCD